MKWYQVRKSDVAEEINIGIGKVYILEKGLPIYKYIIPFIQIIDG